LPRNVLSIVSTLWRCGPVNVLEGIVRDYDAANYRAVVATLSPNSRNSAIADFRHLGLQVKELNLSRASSFLVGARRLHDMIHALKIDLVHCHGFRANCFVGACKLPVPTISTIHSHLMKDYQMTYGNVVGTWAARREYRALHSFNCVVAVSEPVAEAARSRGLQCEVIANGVDLDPYRPASGPLEKTLLRDRLQLPPDRTVLLHAGALIDLKRPVEVIAAFADSSLSQDAVLVVAGEGPLLRQCQQLAARATNIRFLGQRRDMPDLLRASDALISNSVSEGLPMALLEACACGIQVIASDIASHRHIQRLFPQQISLYAGHGSEAVRTALDAFRSSDTRHPIQPSQASLHAISAARMSRAYQRLYDTVCVRNGCALEVSP
jgi:glycosyltransferase involved in cell wall biosynthesis